jgi:hypothetical protein
VGEGEKRGRGNTCTRSAPRNKGERSRAGRAENRRHISYINSLTEDRVESKGIPSMSI